jgi:hypothetical protein
LALTKEKKARDIICQHCIAVRVSLKYEPSEINYTNAYLVTCRPEKNVCIPRRKGKLKVNCIRKMIATEILFSS